MTSGDGVSVDGSWEVDSVVELDVLMVVDSVVGEDV